MKRLISLFISVLMVLSSVVLVPVYAADAPSIDDSHLLITAADGNGMSKSGANALKGAEGFTYAEDIKITSLSSGAYFGVWVGRASTYIAGYNADTEELMVAKRKLGTVGGFDTTTVLGRTSFALAKNTAYRFELKVNGTNAEILINGTVKLTVEDSNVGTPATLIAYHTGVDAQIDNFVVANVSGDKVAELDFAEKADFADNGWEFAIDSGYSIPGIIEKPTPVEDEYLLKVEYGTNYMDSVVYPYDFAGFTYELDVCPLDTTTMDEEREPTYAGVYFSDFHGKGAFYVAVYNFTRQRFEITKTGMPHESPADEDYITTVDYKWEDYYTSGEYNWHKLGFRMSSGKFIITVDGNPVVECENSTVFSAASYYGNVIVGYTRGEFYLDNIKLAKTLSYDCATGEGEVISYEDFDATDYTNKKSDIWNPITAGRALIEQANTQNVCTSKDNYSDTPSPDPEIVVEKKVLHSPQNAKYIDTGSFKLIDGSFTSSLDITYIAPRTEGDALYGFLLGRNNKVFAGYNLASGKFVITPWLGDAKGCDVENAYEVSDPFTMEQGKWYNFGVRSIGSSIELYVDGECMIDADNSEFANIPLDTPVKFYSLGEYYIDNWVLADTAYNLAEDCGVVNYKMKFDTDSFEAKILGIEDAMVGYDIVDAKCKGAAADAVYDCNFKLLGEGEGFTAYECDLCGVTVAYDDDGNVVEIPEAGIAGDANNDKKLTAADAILILQYAAKWNPENFHTDLANVTDDDAVNAKDAIEILRSIARWGNELIYHGPSAEIVRNYDSPVITSVAKEEIGTGTQTAINVKSKSYAMKVDVAEGEYLQSIAFIYSPSWGNALGGYNVSVYKWDTDYATTILTDVLSTGTIVDFPDNTTLSFKVSDADDLCKVTNGTYLIVLTGAAGASGKDTAGVWGMPQSGTERNIEVFEGGVTPSAGLIPHSVFTFGYTD